MFTQFLAIVSAYLVGSIPTGYLIARWSGIDDIRKIGSGNIGATNVARFLGVHFFFVILFFDACKACCLLKFLAYKKFNMMSQLYASCALLLGNSCSIFLRGSGGKGVATSVGILFVLQPKLVLFLFAWWLVLFLVTNVVGIASVGTLAVAPFLARYMASPIPIFYLIVGMSVWGIYLHRANIARFLKVA